MQWICETLKKHWARIGHLDMEIPVCQKPKSRSRMLICYLCGREYGTKSLQIHIPQCQKKWLDEEAKKPKKDQRLMPQPPKTEIPNKGRSNADSFNDEAYAQWESTLEQCPYCDRRFRLEAFQHHQKGCTAKNPAKKAGTGLTTASLSNRLLPSLISGTRRGSKTKTEENLSRCTSPGLKADINSGGLRQSSDNMVENSKSKGCHRKSIGGLKPIIANYCDNCGEKYPRIESKFCSNCGTKRVGL